MSKTQHDVLQSEAKPSPEWMHLTDLIKASMKPSTMFHSLVSSLLGILLLVGFGVGGFFIWKNNEISVKTADQVELLNKYYILQNQQTLLLKVLNEKLRDSDKAAFGSAPMEEKAQTAKMMYDMASVKQVPIHILCGIAEVESSWNTHAVSSAGCVGLLQITPMYARAHLRERGVTYKQDIWFDPAINVMCGVSMLADMQAEYVEKDKAKPDDWQIAIHSYFWGPSNTNQLFGKQDQRVNVPNMAYPMKVMEAAKKYKEMGL